ncbi:MAG: permease [Spirochaetota bacterium]
MWKSAVDHLLYTLLKLPAGNRLVGALHFFIFDTVKIFFLLAVIIFVISFMRTYFSVARTRALLGNKLGMFGNVLAALLGIVTPFCSCSAVPLFIGFVEAGIPLGVTFSFLIASPMINEVALVMLAGLFGWKVALIYIASGLVIAIVSGIVIGVLRLEKWIEPFVFETKVGTMIEDRMTMPSRFRYARDHVGEILKKIWPFVLVAIGIGAFIHGYVPEQFFAKYLGTNAWYAVPLATLLGVPLYSNAAGIVPVVEALVSKGVPLGTALAFMMAVTALSFPEFVILRRVLKPKLLGVFIGVVSAGIMLTGFLFNALYLGK